MWKKQTSAPPAGVSPPDQGISREHTLALRPIVERLGGRNRPCILDLGPASGGNVRFFSRFAGKLLIGDLHDEIRDGRFDPSTREHATALPWRNDGENPPLDLILAWDLFNYLELAHLRAFIRSLSRCCVEDTLLFALIWTRKEMPAAPQRFTIVGPDAIRYESMTDSRRPCPQYREPDLTRAMPGFQVETTFLLRNGVQEYLFAYEPPAAEADAT